MEQQQEACGQGGGPAGLPGPVRSKEVSVGRVWAECEPSVSRVWAEGEPSVSRVIVKPSRAVLQ